MRHNKIVKNNYHVKNQYKKKTLPCLRVVADISKMKF